MELSKEVISLIAKQLNKKEEEITEQSEILKDLGADSLDVVEMLMELEETYGITIPVEEASKLKTVGDIIKVIEESKN